MNRTNEEFRKLERAMARAWPAFETIDYDGWIIRFADGYTKRSNSVNPHFGSSLPLGTKIAHCESVYRERGLPTIFRLTPFSQPENLDSTLARIGYQTFDPTLVMTCSFDSVLDNTVEPVSVMPADPWFAAFDRLRKLETFERACHRQIIESSEGLRCFAAVMDDGKPIACGLGVLVDDTVGLFDLFTCESHRGQGLGSSIVRSILRWASHRGAGTGFLQVHTRNAPARRLYERFGFEIAYPYGYRIQA